MRWQQAVLVVATIASSWLAMQAIHELGHVAGAWLTGAQIARVELNPLSISQTTLGSNPQPLWVVWAGPVLGCAIPLFAWAMAARARLSICYLMRFFAGFCLIANGGYIGFGSLDGVGDCGQMLRHGSALWQLWLFGAVTMPLGLALWHGQARAFGLGPERRATPKWHGILMLGVLFLLLGFGFLTELAQIP